MAPEAGFPPLEAGELLCLLLPASASLCPGAAQGGSGARVGTACRDESPGEPGPALLLLRLRTASLELAPRRLGSGQAAGGAHIPLASLLAQKQNSG